jgi:hypothetical protein
MTLSVVIICWNDLTVIAECLRSIFESSTGVDLEVIISDNDSTDDSIEFIRRNYPQVHIVQNGANLGFAKGNNAGIRVTRGRYVLILNPDTIVHKGALKKWLEFAESHPEAGAFGCRVLNPDGSYQGSARPFPTIRRDWIAALCLRPLGRFSDAFTSDIYTGWPGDTKRPVDWQSGCCILVRSTVLKELGGFDESFFYHFEEVDLCRRIWNTGWSILYNPEVTITHLGGQSVKRFPVRFALERQRGRYRYFYKHFGRTAARRARYTALAWFGVRQVGYGLLHLIRPTDTLQQRLLMYRAVLRWTTRIDPVRFVEEGLEPDVVLGQSVSR